MRSAVSAFLAKPPAYRREDARPQHVLFPDEMLHNVDELRSVLGATRLAYRIFYAHKANRSPVYVAAARLAGIGCDVASTAELETALSCGLAARDIEATGPKSLAFVERLVSSGAVVNCDSPGELDAVIARATALGRTDVPVLLRLARGVNESSVLQHAMSRFGVRPSELVNVLSRLSERADTVRFLGFSFHVDSSEIDDRAGAFSWALRAHQLARQQGLSPSVINVGGGLRQRFVDDVCEYRAYVEAIKAGLDGKALSMGWGGEGFGLRVDASGHPVGTPIFHKYGADISAPKQLQRFLSCDLTEYRGLTVERALRENGLELWLELGKSLLDGAGVTVSHVLDVRHLDDTTTVVQLDIKRDDVVAMDQEGLVDPIILARCRQDEREALTHGAFFSGVTCLERDMVVRRRVAVPFCPNVGDRVVFANTAAYLMDLSASEALGHPKPRKFVWDASCNELIDEQDWSSR